MLCCRVSVPSVPLEMLPLLRFHPPATGVGFWKVGSQYLSACPQGGRVSGRDLSLSIRDFRGVKFVMKPNLSTETVILKCVGFSMDGLSSPELNRTG
ncbi:hypothetical protein BUALT_Bualt08G0013300 [Buddleja alternifolia]|uniref:Uncharacterized protein n=1 Tax=Buddleja alternifolia TaxID=168488 RepID=A0AAV6XAV5_9LAMI|nr:hypothetical protein BUALT_Bualt08G0013300 [Buddleja alternifolia]